MWAFYALLSAIFAASIDPVAKVSLRKSDEYLVGWFGLLFSLPFLAVPFFAGKAPVFTPAFFRIILVAMPFEVVAAIFYYKAIRSSDISASVPFLSITPIFSAMLAYFLMGERIGRQGILGVCLITVGVYSMNIKEARYSLMHPIKAIFTNKGSLYMVFVGLLFAFTSTFSKMAMLRMTPETIAFIYTSAVVISFSPIIFYRISRGLSKIERTGEAYMRYALMGALFAVASFTYFKSVSMANLAYAISIKRLSLLVSIGYGWFLFRERDVQIRFLSTACMCAGVILIIRAAK